MVFHFSLLIYSFVVPEKKNGKGKETAGTSRADK